MRRSHSSPVMLTRSCGARVPVAPGQSVLEALRAHGLAHAAICGGKARCTTCRVRVTAGAQSLPAAEAAERNALSRIGAPAEVRLACQIHPKADLAIMPLLPADATMDELGGGGLDGRETEVVVVFVDLRDSTALAEARLPYDVLFILNRFFLEMSRAVAASGGHYANFTGDGLMALYGLDAGQATEAARQALDGAQAMLDAVSRINRDLATELPHPLRIGIGIHAGLAIVGTMGPPSAQLVSAIGDTVNTAARLEGLCKTYDCPLVVSAAAMERAGRTAPAETLHLAAVKGRTEPVAVHALHRIALI